MFDSPQLCSIEAGGAAAVTGRAARPRRGRRAGGFTLIEILFALAVLALVLAGLSAAAGTNQNVVTNSGLQTIATAAAQSQLDFWMSANFSGTYSNANVLLYGYSLCRTGGATVTETTDNTINNGSAGLSSNSANPYSPIWFSVVAPGFPANNTLGSVIIREPTAAEMPWYNKGNGPKWTSGSNPPSTAASAGAGVSCLMIFVRVDIPAGPGHSAVHVTLSGVRYAI